MGGPPHVNRVAWRDLAITEGWDVKIAFHLLSVIESTFAKAAAENA